MLLDESPDPDWDIAYAGWDRSGADASSAIAIHQPSTDEKAISFNDDTLTIQTSCIGGFAPDWRTPVISGLLELAHQYRVPLLLHTEFSRNTYLLANFPDERLVGRLVTSEPR